MKKVLVARESVSRSQKESFFALKKDKVRSRADLPEAEKKRAINMIDKI